MVPRIHGLTLIRDEWPLALLAINHALLHHVDQLHCAVQVSDDVRHTRIPGDEVTS